MPADAHKEAAGLGVEVAVPGNTLVAVGGKRQRIDLRTQQRQVDSQPVLDALIRPTRCALDVHSPADWSNAPWMLNSRLINSTCGGRTHVTGMSIEHNFEINGQKPTICASCFARLGSKRHYAIPCSKLRGPGLLCKPRTSRLRPCTCAHVPTSRTATLSQPRFPRIGPPLSCRPPGGPQRPPCVNNLSIAKQGGDGTTCCSAVRLILGTMRKASARTMRLISTRQMRGRRAPTMWMFQVMVPVCDLSRQLAFEPYNSASRRDRREPV